MSVRDKEYMWPVRELIMRANIVDGYSISDFNILHKYQQLVKKEVDAADILQEERRQLEQLTSSFWPWNKVKAREKTKVCADLAQTIRRARQELIELESSSEFKELVERVRKTERDRSDPLASECLREYRRAQYDSTYAQFRHASLYYLQEKFGQLVEDHKGEILLFINDCVPNRYEYTLENFEAIVPKLTFLCEKLPKKIDNSRYYVSPNIDID